MTVTAATSSRRVNRALDRLELQEPTYLGVES